MRPSQKTGVRNALFRKQGQTFGAGFYLLVSLVFFIISTVETDSMNKFRRFTGDIIAPVIVGIGAPIQWTSDGLNWADNVVRVFSINQELRNENQLLKEWQSAAQVLSLENKRLKELLSSGDFKVPTLVTARVIGVTGGPYVRSVLINKGESSGVRDGHPVVDENGVVGRAIIIGENSARVLLINDLNSRVPVRVERTNQNAMVVGQNDELMSLMFYPVDADIQVGDRLFTSGHGRAYAPDLLVGTVTAIENDGIFVSPAAELQQLDYVRVLDFDARMLEPSSDGEHFDIPIEQSSNSGGGN